MESCRTSFTPPVCFCHQGFLIKSFLQLFVTDITLRTAVNSICRYVGQLCRVVRICGMRPCLYGEKLSPEKDSPSSLVSFCDPLLTLCPCQKLRHFARACSNCLALIELSQRALQSVLARAGE